VICLERGATCKWFAYGPAYATATPIISCFINPPMPKEGVKTTPSGGLLWIIFLSYADTTDIFFVSVPKHQRYFLTYYTPLYPGQVRFVRSWNISDNTDKPTRSSSVISLALLISFYWARTSYKSRPLPVCEQLRPRPLLFLVLLNILDIKYSMFDRHLC